MSVSMVVGLVLVGAVVSFVLAGVRYIPNHSVGIVEKRGSARGSLDQGFIALNGEAGFQPEVLRGGVHLLMPIQYRVRRVPLVTIPQGKIGDVFARDGRPLAPGQALADNRHAQDFQDARAFLTRGGQQGPQRQLLREGTYAIHLAQFVILT